MNGGQIRTCVLASRQIKASIHQTQMHHLTKNLCTSMFSVQQFNLNYNLGNIFLKQHSYLTLERFHKQFFALSQYIISTQNVVKMQLLRNNIASFEGILTHCYSYAPSSTQYVRIDAWSYGMQQRNVTNQFFQNNDALTHKIGQRMTSQIINSK